MKRASKRSGWTEREVRVRVPARLLFFWPDSPESNPRLASLGPTTFLCPRSMEGSSRPGGSLARSHARTHSHHPDYQFARPAGVGSSCLHAWERTVHVLYSTVHVLCRQYCGWLIQTDTMITARYHLPAGNEGPVESCCDALMDGSWPT